MVRARAYGAGRRSPLAIGALLQGEVPRKTILGILLVKSVIWAVSLGSGTSGGVLAPIFSPSETTIGTPSATMITAPASRKSHGWVFRYSV